MHIMLVLQHFFWSDAVVTAIHGNSDTADKSLTGDVSPEELRFACYKARAEGPEAVTAPAHTQHVHIIPNTHTHTRARTRTHTLKLTHTHAHRAHARTSGSKRTAS